MALPGVDIDHVKAKLDTGARSSSLHAFEVSEFEREGTTWVRFSLHPWQKSDEDARVVELPIHDRRTIRSSNGQVQQRYVVLMEIALLQQVITAEVTLSRRDAMGFRLLIGREALRQGFLVHSGRSYFGGRPPKEVRRRNRGIGER